MNDDGDSFNHLIAIREITGNELSDHGDDGGAGEYQTSTLSIHAETFHVGYNLGIDMRIRIKEGCENRAFCFSYSSLKNLKLVQK